MLSPTCVDSPDTSDRGSWHPNLLVSAVVSRSAAQADAELEAAPVTAVPRRPA
jgi:hypothetical protein